MVAIEDETGIKTNKEPIPCWFKNSKLSVLRHRWKQKVSRALSTSARLASSLWCVSFLFDYKPFLGMKVSDDEYNLTDHSKMRKTGRDKFETCFTIAFKIVTRLKV